MAIASATLGSLDQVVVIIFSASKGLRSVKRTSKNIVQLWQHNLSNELYRGPTFEHTHTV